MSFDLHVTLSFLHCSCMHLQNQRHNLAVVEAAGFTLSQLLQAEDAAEKIIPYVPSLFSRHVRDLKKKKNATSSLKKPYIEIENELTDLFSAGWSCPLVYPHICCQSSLLIHSLACHLQLNVPGVCTTSAAGEKQSLTLF